MGRSSRPAAGPLSSSPCPDSESAERSPPFRRRVAERFALSRHSVRLRQEYRCSARERGQQSDLSSVAWRKTANPEKTDPSLLFRKDDSGSEPRDPRPAARAGHCPHPAAEAELPAPSRQSGRPLEFRGLRSRDSFLHCEPRESAQSHWYRGKPTRDGRCADCPAGTPCCGRRCRDPVLAVSQNIEIGRGRRPPAKTSNPQSGFYRAFHSAIRL